MEPISKEDLTRDTVLGIASENAIIHAAVSQWRLGHLTWEQALIYAIWAMNGRASQLERMFREGLAATMPKMEVAMTRTDFEGFVSQNRLTVAAPDLLAACEAFVTAYEKSLQLEKTDTALRLARAAIAKTKGQ